MHENFWKTLKLKTKAKSELSHLSYGHGKSIHVDNGKKLNFSNFNHKRGWQNIFEKTHTLIFQSILKDAFN